jgi:hypothetical protein
MRIVSSEFKFNDSGARSADDIHFFCNQCLVLDQEAGDGKFRSIRDSLGQTCHPTRDLPKQGPTPKINQVNHNFIMLI